MARYIEGLERQREPKGRRDRSFLRLASMAQLGQNALYLAIAPSLPVVQQIGIIFVVPRVRRLLRR